MVPLSLYLSDTQYSVPSIVNNNPSTSVQSFVRSLYYTLPAPINSSVDSVSITSISYYGPTFESNDDRLN